MKAEESHAELRDAVRALCRGFDSAYWQKIDEARAYPETFVEALTKAGWMSALIPEEFGGSGLSLTEASVIMEEITRTSGTLHKQVRGRCQSPGRARPQRSSGKCDSQHGEPRGRRRRIPRP